MHISVKFFILSLISQLAYWFSSAACFSISCLISFVRYFSNVVKIPWVSSAEPYHFSSGPMHPGTEPPCSMLWLLMKARQKDCLTLKAFGKASTNLLRSSSLDGLDGSYTKMHPWMSCYTGAQHFSYLKSPDRSQSSM